LAKSKTSYKYREELPRIYTKNHSERAGTGEEEGGGRASGLQGAGGKGSQPPFLIKSDEAEGNFMFTPVFRIRSD